jgi:hypothetical protein
LSIPLEKSKEVASSCIVPLLPEAHTTFLAFHLMLPTTQKLLDNHNKRMRKIWYVGCKRVQCLMMDELKTD